jgi:hypothetical protein
LSFREQRRYFLSHVEFLPDRTKAVAGSKGKRQRPFRATWNGGSLVLGSVVLLGIALSDSSHSLRESAIPSLLMLPIFLVGGYLAALWQWQNFEKKYPEDKLLPWE